MRELIVPIAALVVALTAAAAGGSATRGPASGTWYSDHFVSPTGNIHCRYFAYDQLMACKTLNNGQVAVAPLFGPPYVGYIGDYSFPNGPVLNYGSVYTVRGQFRCVSQTNGMFCRSSRTGRGFGLAREGYRLF